MRRKTSRYVLAASQPRRLAGIAPLTAAPQKTFIIATLCSTLVGTFTSSIGLWDRVQDKRKQKKTDHKQDDEIKKLREQVENAEKRSKERDAEMRRRDELGDSFERSGAMIQRQYDEGYRRLGGKFAMGDSTCLSSAPVADTCR